MSFVMGLLAWLQLTIDQAVVQTNANVVTNALSGLVSVFAGLVVGAVILSVVALLLIRMKS